MGIYHIAGLGKSPGAVTVPLSCAFYLLYAVRNGDKRAQEFFMWSGEKENINENKGMIEGVILFTSQEIIEKPLSELRKSRKSSTSITCTWFQKNFSGKTGGEIIRDYLFELEKYFFGDNSNVSVKYLYLVAIGKIDDYEDTLKIVAPTLKALMNKELWINQIAGTNAVNAALLISSLILGASTTHYYVFQQDINALCPEWITSPKDLSGVDETIKRWHTLPFFHLEIEKWCMIYEMFRNRNDTPIHVNEIRESLGLDENAWKQVIPKLRGRVFNINKDTVLPGPMLQKMIEIYNMCQNAPRNLSEWKEWLKSNNIKYKAMIER